MLNGKISQTKTAHIFTIVIKVFIHIRGVQKNTKFIYELSDKIIPFLWGIIRSTENFKFLGGREVLPLDSKNIQRKF